MKIWTGYEAAERHIELLYGDRTQDVAVRLIKKGLPALTKEGPLDWSWIESGQEVGYAVYIRPNREAWKDEEITVAPPALFIDADDLEMPSALDWHVTPDFVVSRSAMRWQAWWCAGGYCSLDQWRTGMRQLAAHYGTDKSVTNPCTLMRLAGTRSTKNDGKGLDYILDDFT